MRRALLLLVLLVASALAGCSHEEGDDPPPTTTPTATTPVDEPRLTFGGRVLDALTLEPIEGASVRLDVAQVRPCRREGIVWNSYGLDVNETGRFGPYPLPRPKSDEIAFFLHAEAPGHAPNATFIGPDEARAGTRNLTILLHPDVALEGTAPPGTVVALDAPGFPRLSLANETGHFVFPQARAVQATWVAATEPPQVGRATPPATLDLATPNGTTWRLEGVVKGPTGAPLEADVVAREGAGLVSAGRSGPNGLFVLPLGGEPQDLLLEARTPDGAYGGVLRVVVDGPPALRQSLLLQALC